jgi:TPR repeat protein
MSRILRFGFLLLLLHGSSSTAGYDEGVAAYQRGDYATAYREFSDAAKQGDGDAIVNLLFSGKCLRMAEIMAEPPEKDELKLLRLRQAAAKSAGAKYWLAFSLEQSLINSDRVEIEKLRLESAEGGYPLAMADLGWKYGTSTQSFDPVRAYAWTALALRRMAQNPDPVGSAKIVIKGAAQEVGNANIVIARERLKKMTFMLSADQLAQAKELTDQLDKQTPRSKLIMLKVCSTPSQK